MIPLYWRQLVITSIKDPASAARSLMALQLPSQVLWTALALVAVLNTALFTLSNLLMPGPSPLPETFNSPMVYLTIVVVGLILTIYALFWVGRLFGGKGSVADIMVLIVWMQVLRVLAQGAALILVMTLPFLAMIEVFAATLIGVYMLVHFVDQAHRFGSIGRSALVLIASLLAIAVGLSLIVAFVGGPNVGSLPNV
ncbi:MAG: hypothetical protein ACI8R4_002270 [Paracoccaceae bacterium]|jgi:hypothetical protein